MTPNISKESGPHVTGNYFDKYSSRNPLYRTLVAGFLRAVGDLIVQSKPQRILEVGCAEGNLAFRILTRLRREAGYAPEYWGIDIGEAEIASARARFPGLSFEVASAYALPFPDRSFDMIVACEVLEHLDRPEDGLREMERVCSGRLLASVPWEPMWRILNMARGQYWRNWGNTPGHVQHFNRKQFQQLISSRFSILERRQPFPWSVVLAQRSEMVKNPERSGKLK